jgi:hypothetical protein
VPVRTYEVSVDSEIPEAEPRGGRIPGPYVADTFAVHVEDAYVVVETTPRPAAQAPDVRAAGGAR